MKSILAPVFLFAAAATCSMSMAQTPTGAAQQPGQIIYLPQLPTAESLTSSAGSQGMSIASIRQTGNEEVVTYHFANGPDSVVAYRVLPSSTGVAGQPPPPAPVATYGTAYAPTTAAPTTTVVYSAAAPAYYYGYAGYPAYYGYSGYPWYGGISVGLGGYYGRGWGGYYGGYRGGYGGGFRGGWGGRR